MSGKVMTRVSREHNIDVCSKGIIVNCQLNMWDTKSLPNTVSHMLLKESHKPIPVSTLSGSKFSKFLKIIGIWKKELCRQYCREGYLKSWNFTFCSAAIEKRTLRNIENKYIQAQRMFSTLILHDHQNKTREITYRLLTYCLCFP